jgi:uncharacterized delta-60 repeat protein
MIRSALPRGLRRAWVSLAFALLLAGVTCDAAFAQDGLLDLHFGRPGTFTPFGQEHAGAVTMAVQPDGKIVAAGFATVKDDQIFALARYNADATLDPSFGETGTIVTPFDADYAIAVKVALQPDGKIVVVGTTFSIGGLGSEDGLIVRYNANGSLDRTFGGGHGFAVVDVPGADAAVFDIDIEADGKLFALGFATTTYDGPDSSRLLLMRLNADGSVDTSYGDRGMLRVFPHEAGGGAPGRLLPDGTILAAGYDFKAQHLRVSRLLRDGTVDRTFNDGRPAEANLPTEVKRVLHVTLQSDGKIVLLGQGTFAKSFDRSGELASNSPDIFLARLNADGTRDITFGRNGIMVTDVPLSGGPTHDDPASQMALQPDGKVLVAATVMPAGGSQMLAALLRYGTDGELDPSFGNNGIVMASFTDPSRSTYQAIPRGITVQADGKILLAAEAMEPGSDREIFAFTLLRFENGSLSAAAKTLLKTKP